LLEATVAAGTKRYGIYPHPLIIFRKSLSSNNGYIGYRCFHPSAAPSQHHEEGLRKLGGTDLKEEKAIMKTFFRPLVIFTLLVPLLLSGCFVRTLTVKYDASKGQPVKFNVKRKLTAAVFPFADLRNDEPTRIGGIYGPAKELYTRVYTPEKAAVIFAKAMADELEQMGFVVIDQASAPFLPEGVTVLREAKALRKLNPSLDMAIYGQIREMEVISFYGYRTNLKVKIFIVDVRKEKLVWSGTVSSRIIDIKTTTGGLLEVMAERLEDTLNKGIKDFLNSKEFREVITSFL
jgi:hypothetical protein